MIMKRREIKKINEIMFKLDRLSEKALYHKKDFGFDGIHIGDMKFSVEVGGLKFLRELMREHRIWVSTLIAFDKPIYSVIAGCKPNGNFRFIHCDRSFITPLLSMEKHLLKEYNKVGIDLSKSWDDIVKEETCY